MPLTFWLYTSVSSSLAAAAADAVAQIVEESRARNALLSITGALVFTGTRFAQYVEGPVANVEAVKASILADDRHSDIRTHSEGERRERWFPDWTLAYSGSSKSFDRVIGFAHARNDTNGDFLLMEMLGRFTRAKLS